MKLSITRLLFLSLTLYGCYKSKDHSKYRCLTNLGLYMSVITVCVGFFKRFTCNKLLMKIHRFLVSVSLPINSTMFLFYYWPILFHGVNQSKSMKLYLHEGVRSIFIDICQHLSPEIGILCEIIDVDVINSKYQRIFLVLYGTVYFLFCVKISCVKGLWPYTYLEKKGMCVKVGFYLAIVLISLLVYEIMVLVLKKKTVTDERREKVKTQ